MKFLPEEEHDTDGTDDAAPIGASVCGWSRAVVADDFLSLFA
jgi:hypothetical protein